MFDKGQTSQQAAESLSWSLQGEIHLSENGEAGELGERHSFRLLYVSVIQIAYSVFE